MQLRATLLLAILLVAAVPYAAEAAEPERAAWSPHQVSARVTAVALAKEGTTLAVANAAVAVDPNALPGGAPVVPRTDFRVFDVLTGRLFNSTDGPSGKRATATSADGRFVAAAGTNLGSEMLTFYAVTGPAPSSAGSSEPGSQSPRWTRTLAGPVADIAMSGDGRRIAVVLNTATSGRAVLYDSDGSLIFQHDGAERLSSVDISKDGQWIVAGGRHKTDAGSVGAVYLFRYPSGDPLRQMLQTATNATGIREVRMTPDGSVIAAVTAGGQVLAYRNEGVATKDAITFGVSATNVTSRALALSGDGRYIAVAVDKTITLLERTPAALTPRWTHVAPDVVNSLDANHTGAVIVAGVNGASGGAFAFSPRSSDPYWKVGRSVTQNGGDIRNVTVNAKGTWVAFGEGHWAHARQLHHRLALLFETGPGIGVPSAPPASTQPFRAVTLPLLLANEGASPERVEINVPTIKDVTIALNRSRIDVVPGETARLAVTITPGRLQPGTYSFNATARSLDAPTHVSNLTIAFSVTPVSEVEVSLDGAGERSIGPGGNDSVRVVVVNNGNNPADVSVDVTQRPSTGADWQVRLVGESRFSLASGGLSTLRVLVEPPRDAINGSSNLVRVNVRTPAGASAVEVLYNVNPFVAVNVTGPGGLRIVPKFVYAGQTTQFNLTVTNTGSIPAQFQAHYEPPRITGDRTWVVDLDITPFPLGPGENRTLPVRVFAPKDAAEGHRLATVVEVRNVVLHAGVNQARENVTIIANVARPPPDAPTPATHIPAPGLIAMLAAAGAAALVFHSRKVSP